MARDQLRWCEGEKLNQQNEADPKWSEQEQTTIHFSKHGSNIMESRQNKQPNTTFLSFFNRIRNSHTNTQLQDLISVFKDIQWIFLSCTVHHRRQQYKYKKEHSETKRTFCSSFSWWINKLLHQCSFLLVKGPI